MRPTYRKVYSVDGGPSHIAKLSRSTLHFAPSKKTMALLGAIQQAHDKGTIHKRSMSTDRMHIVKY